MDNRTPQEKAYDSLRDGSAYAKPADVEIEIARQADQAIEAHRRSPLYYDLLNWVDSHFPPISPDERAAILSDLDRPMTRDERAGCAGAAMTTLYRALDDDRAATLVDLLDELIDATDAERNRLIDAMLAAAAE
jgi:hypothetical protein